MNNINISKPERNVGADIIRCLAFFCVVAVHFFLNTNFYTVRISGEKMLVAVFLRTFFIICVPLYMMLSGFLMRNKKLSINHYKKLGNTYLTYVLASLCCIIYSAFVLKDTWTFKTIVLSILNFTAAPYSWYVEMYLGLFLIVPFLNILYNNIPTKKGKIALLVVMIAITAMPAVLNVYNFDSVSWWLQPSASRAYSKIVPSWWTFLYPLTYYFIGCYLSEYGLKLKKITNILLILLAWGLSGLYICWRSYKSTFIWGDWCDYESIFNVLLSVLVFVFFLNLDYSKLKPSLTRFLKNVSALCFASYLVSWIFDWVFYTPLIEKIPKMTDRLPYFIIIVPLVFVSSLALSFIISKLQMLLSICFGLLQRKKSNSKQPQAQTQNEQ